MLVKGVPERGTLNSRVSRVIVHQDDVIKGNIFRVTGTLWGEFTGEFPSQRQVTRSFDVFFDLRLNKRLSKELRRWWFETPWRSLWRHCYVSWLCHLLFQAPGIPVCTSQTESPWTSTADIPSPTVCPSVALIRPAWRSTTTSTHRSVGFTVRPRARRNTRPKTDVVHITRRFIVENTFFRHKWE